MYNTRSTFISGHKIKDWGTIRINLECPFSTWNVRLRIRLLNFFEK